MRARGSPSLSLEEAQSEDWLPGDGWLPRGIGAGEIEPLLSPARSAPLDAGYDPAPFDVDTDFRANTAMGRNADQSWRPEQWQGMEGERAPGYSVGGDDYALPHAAWETAIGRAPVPEFSPENAADIERRWNEREAIGAAMAARSARQLRDRTTPFGVITAPFVNTMVEPERRRAFVDWLDEPLLPEEWFTEEAWDRAGQSVQEAVAGAPDAIAGLPAATERVARETPSTMRRLGDALGEGYDWVSRQADPDVFDEPDFVGGVGSLALEYGPDILRGVTYGPWENEGELQAQLELARELERRGLGDAEAVNELARSANAEAGWAGVNAAFAPLDVPALAQFGREVIGMAPRASARLGAEASRTIPDSAPRSYEGAPSPQGEVIDVPFEVVEPRTQRRFEAAVQDPETGQVYAGLDHAEAIDAIPDEAVRARLDALYQSDPSFGGFNVDGRYMSREEGMASMREAAGRPSVRIGEQVNRDGSVSASDPIDWDAEIAPERASWRDLGLGAGALTAGGAALYAGDAEASDGVDADALTIGGLAAALGVPAAVAAAYLASRGRGARLPLGAATEPLERAVGRAGRAANDDMLARLEAAGTDFMDEPPMSGIDLSGRPIHENSEWVPHRLWEQSNPYGVSRGAWRDGDITGRANMNLDDEILENLNDLPMETREPFMREQPHFFNEGDIEGLRTDYDRALIEQAGTPAERARTRWGVDDPVLRGPALDISPDDILPRPAGFGRRLGEQDPIPLTMPNEDRYLFGRPEIRGTSRETASVPLDAGTNQLPEQRLNSAGNRRGVYDNNLRNGDRNAQIVDLREQFGRNAQADGGRGRRAEGSADHIAAVMRGEQPLPDGSFIETPRPEVTRSTVLGVWKRADDAARAAAPPEEAFRGLEEFGISPERARAISAQRNPGTDPLAIGALALGTGALALGAGEAEAQEGDDPDRPEQWDSMQIPFTPEQRRRYEAIMAERDAQNERARAAAEEPVFAAPAVEPDSSEEDGLGWDDLGRLALPSILGLVGSRVNRGRNPLIGGTMGGAIGGGIGAATTPEEDALSSITGGSLLGLGSAVALPLMGRVGDELTPRSPNPNRPNFPPPPERIPDARERFGSLEDEVLDQELRAGRGTRETLEQGERRTRPSPIPAEERLERPDDAIGSLRNRLMGSQFNIDRLRVMAREVGLDESGTKAELAQRLVDAARRDLAEGASPGASPPPGTQWPADPNANPSMIERWRRLYRQLGIPIAITGASVTASDEAR